HAAHEFYHGLHGFIGLHGWPPGIQRAPSIDASPWRFLHPCHPKYPWSKKAGACVEATMFDPPIPNPWSPRAECPSHFFRGAHNFASPPMEEKLLILI